MYQGISGHHIYLTVFQESSSLVLFAWFPLGNLLSKNRISSGHHLPDKIFLTWSYWLRTKGEKTITLQLGQGSTWSTVLSGSWLPCFSWSLARAHQLQALGLKLQVQEANLTERSLLLSDLGWDNEPKWLWSYFRKIGSSHSLTYYLVFKNSYSETGEKSMVKDTKLALGWQRIGFI